MSKTKLLVLDALLISITICFKEVMTFLPNVELVTIFLMIFSINMKLKDSLLISLCYSTIESLLYGFGIYSFAYYFVWLIIVLITYLLKNKIKSYIGFAFLALFYGLLFDIPFSIPYFLLSYNSGISYLMAGIIFDIVHGLSNFILTILLFDYLQNIFKKLYVNTID